MVREDAVERLGDLCGQRAAAIQQMAGAVGQRRALQPQLADMQKDVATAGDELGGAQREVLAVRTALQAARGPAADALRQQLKAASGRFAEKEKNFQKAQGRLRAFLQQQVRPLNEKIAAGWQDVMRIYVRMRELVPTDRTDPAATAVAAAYASECGRQQDFVEGHVLGAITAIYRDDLQTATDSLDAAAPVPPRVSRKCVLRERYEALQSVGNKPAKQTLAAIDTALNAGDLTLDDMDWAEQQFNDEVSLETLEGDEQRRYRRYLEFTRDQFTKHEW